MNDERDTGDTRTAQAPDEPRLPQDAHDPQNEHWLRALAGEPDPQAEAGLNRQALQLRLALQARGQALDRAVPAADDALLEQLRFRLRREGLTEARPPSARPPQPRPWQGPPVWGLAATVLMGMGALLHLHLALREELGTADTLRGGQATTLQVADAEARLATLQAGLRAAGAEPRLARRPDGRITLQVNASAAALDYLASQRIDPVVRDGRIELVLVPAGAAARP